MKRRKIRSLKRNQRLLDQKREEVPSLIIDQLPKRSLSLTLLTMDLLPLTTTRTDTMTLPTTEILNLLGVLQEIIQSEEDTALPWEGMVKEDNNLTIHLMVTLQDHPTERKDMEELLATTPVKSSSPVTTEMSTPITLTKEWRNFTKELRMKSRETRSTESEIRETSPLEILLSEFEEICCVA